MAKKVRVKMNSRGALAILNSPGVQADLLRRAQAIQAGANSTLPGDAAPYDADVQTGRRARAMVKTTDAANRRHEGKTNAILKNLDRGAG